MDCRKDCLGTIEHSSVSLGLLVGSMSKGNPFHNELNMPNNFHGSIVEVLRGGVHVCVCVCVCVCVMGGLKYTCVEVWGTQLTQCLVVLFHQQAQELKQLLLYSLLLHGTGALQHLVATACHQTLGRRDMKGR